MIYLKMAELAGFVMTVPPLLYREVFHARILSGNVELYWRPRYYTIVTYVLDSTSAEVSAHSMLKPI